MARAVICLGAWMIGMCAAIPAYAQHQDHKGFIAVTRTQIDPRMAVLSDGPPPSQLPTQGPAGAQDNRDNGMPLDQSDDPDAGGPAGDDPFADNAVETDTVYTI
jgi:hypothetical protein